MYRCRRCGKKSQHPADEQEGYCGNCHAYTGGEPERMGRLPHLTVGELQEQLDAVQRRRAEVEAMLADPLPAASRESRMETAAVLRSLETANAEAILGASAGLPTDTLRLLGDLRRRLAAMEVRSAGGETYTGADLFGRMLDEAEGFVVNHLRAATAQTPLLDEARPTPVAAGAIPQQALLMVEARPAGSCPHCQSTNVDRGATGLDQCRDCDGLSRDGKTLSEAGG